MNTTCSWISFVSRFLLLLVLMGCRPNPVIRPDAAQIQQSELLPRLFPDYRDIALPVNIAPLNFRVDEPVDAVYLQISSSEGDVLELSGTDKLLFESTAWKQLLRTHAGQTLTCRLYGRTQNQWLQWPAFNWSIKSDSIDPYLVYRLIEPGYEKWHKVGIYQRNLENFDEEVLVRNDMTGYNCINCHTFNQGNSDQMLLHMRGEHGGTYLTHNQEIQKLNTKTDQTLSHFSYSYWHPSGRYIAASLNKTWQFFHATTPHKMEVYDDASDVVVYDVETQTIRADASLISEEAYETFPMFSPDGTWLYYCVAPALPMPDSYNELRYSLCRSEERRVGKEC